MKINNQKAGRPTLYNKEILKKVDIYLLSCKDKKDNKITKVNLPKIEALALCLKVNKDTLYTWAKKYPEFSDALEKVRSEQFCRLIDQGLSGTYNATITKLILTSNHGLSDSAKVLAEVKENHDSTEIDQKAKEAITRYLSSLGVDK